MITYQDFESTQLSTEEFVFSAIRMHMDSDEYKIALSADKYDKQMNETITDFIRKIFTLDGKVISDFTASNNKIACNYFHRLNTQRCTYSLGNGISFTDHIEDVTNEETGKTVKIDTTKEKLGNQFDTKLKKLAYSGLIHGTSFGFWNLDKLYVFELTEFVPLWDEETGDLRAGIRFWQLNDKKPMNAVLYEEDGYTRYKKNAKGEIELVEEKRSYKATYVKSEEGGIEDITYSNYGAFPIIPFWGSDLHQSTLVGMRGGIDAYDLVRSGFANDLDDCAEIYWIIENAGGMSDDELARFRDRLKINHIAVADTTESKITPHAQDIPFNAREAFLNRIREGIFEDFGGLDVHTIAAGATNDHIDAAYQPLDDNADDFEFQVIEFIHSLLELIGIEDTPLFKRNRISNQKEQTDMVLSAAEYLDEETILKKLPFITVDEVQDILAKKDQEAEDRFSDEEEDDDEDLGLDDEDEPDEIDSQLDDLESLLEE